MPSTPGVLQSAWSPVNANPVAQTTSSSPSSTVDSAVAASSSSAAAAAYNAPASSSIAAATYYGSIGIAVVLILILVMVARIIYVRRIRQIRKEQRANLSRMAGESNVGTNGGGHRDVEMEMECTDALPSYRETFFPYLTSRPLPSLPTLASPTPAYDPTRPLLAAPRRSIPRVPVPELYQHEQTEPASTWGGGWLRVGDNEFSDPPKYEDGSSEDEEHRGREEERVPAEETAEDREDSRERAARLA